MIAFTSPLWIWRNGEAGSWYFVTVPEEQSGQIRAHAFGSPRGFGSVRVEARIGHVTWCTSIFPQKSGYILPIKAAVRRKAGVAEGDELSVSLHLL